MTENCRLQEQRKVNNSGRLPQIHRVFPERQLHTKLFLLPSASGSEAQTMATSFHSTLLLGRPVLHHGQKQATHQLLFNASLPNPHALLNIVRFLLHEKPENKSKSKIKDQ